MSDQPSDSWTITDVLAIWGAVVGTISLGWLIWRDLKDKPDLIVSASVGFLTRPPMPNCLTLTATNVGRRPVTVSGWGGRLHESAGPKCKFFVIHDPSLGGSELPKKLGSGDSLNLITTDFGQIASPHLKTMYITDSTGKEWPVNKSDIESLRQFATQEE